jgi:hypothetical protein
VSQTTFPTKQNPLLFEGSRATSEAWNSMSAVSAEASAEIPFGRMVQKGATDETALALAGAAATDLLGIVAFRHGYSKDVDLGLLGLKPKATLEIVRYGVIWVIAEDAVVAHTTTVRVRHTVGAGALGRFRGAAVAGQTFLLTGVKWRTSASAGQLAQLEIDMAALTATADP